MRQVVNPDGDIEQPVLRSIIDKIREESGIATEVPLDRVIDLSVLRDVRSEAQKDNACCQRA